MGQWSRSASAEINSYICGQLIFSTRVPRPLNGERLVFSANDVGTIGYPHAKE